MSGEYNTCSAHSLTFEPQQQQQQQQQQQWQQQRLRSSSEISKSDGQAPLRHVAREFHHE